MTKSFEKTHTDAGLLRLFWREAGSGYGREELRAKNKHGIVTAPRLLHSLFCFGFFFGQTHTLLFSPLFISGPKFFMVLTLEKGSLCLTVTLPTLPYKYGINKTFIRDATSECFTTPVCLHSSHSVSLLQERNHSRLLPALD